MNHPVEQYTWNLMRALMLELDPDRSGWCIDAGVGRFDFYFEWMHKLGYQTMAIEPVISEEFINVIRQLRNDSDKGTFLPVEGALGRHLTNHVGKGSVLYAVPDREIYSLKEFWGGMVADRVVTVFTLPYLADVYRMKRMTALKLDIEGAEPDVIATLPDLPTELLPQIISFEWGGEHSLSDGIGAWSNEQQHRVQSSFDTLKRLGYGNGLIIGSTGGTDVFMHPIERGTPEPFENDDNWGNAVLTRGDVSIERMMAYMQR